MTSEKQVELLYAKNKKFKKLFDLMFNDFGWSATEIDKDSLRIYRIFKNINEDKT